MPLLESPTQLLAHIGRPNGRNGMDVLKTIRAFEP